MLLDSIVTSPTEALVRQIRAHKLAHKLERISNVNLELVDRHGKKLIFASEKISTKKMRKNV